MNRFLERFSGTVKNRQTQQILKLLNKKRQRGEYASLAEFQEGFQNLMGELIDETIVPSLKLYQGRPFKDVSIETHNEMLTRASNDLISSFEELDKIEEVHHLHETIIHKVLLGNLRSGLSELRSKVALYEFLNKDQNGFEIAKYSTFKETQEERTNRGTGIPNSLFMDPKTKTFLLSKYDADVDLIGDRLGLGVGNKKEIKIQNIEQTFGPTFPSSAFDPVGDSIDDINNIIDQTAGTFWIKSIYQKENTSGINVQLKLTLPGNREINYIEIEPALLRAIKLKKLSWLDYSLTMQSLDMDQEVKEISRIVFSKISTNVLYLDFFVPDYLKFEDENTTNTAASVLNEYLPPAIQEVILNSGSPYSDPVEGYKYQIGFDNIRVGLTDYMNKGLYISQPLLIDPSSSEENEATSMSAIIGLKSNTKRPYKENEGLKFSEDPTANLNFLGSVEYWIIKRDIQENGTTVKTITFPILPMGSSEVVHERLLLTEDTGESGHLDIKNSGRLNFFPDETKPITIYANGNFLFASEPDDLVSWAASVSGKDTTNTVSSPNSGSGNPMVYYVKMDKTLMRLGDVYTVSYTPKSPNSHAVSSSSIDLSGDLSIRNIPGNLILLEESSDISINKYKLYLAIVLRQNTAESQLSPFVEDYTLAVGKKDLLKFEE